MYMDKEWKLAVTAAAEPYLLFDRKNDPAESRNLIGTADNQVTCSRLALKISDFARRTQKQVRVTSESAAESGRVSS